MSYDNKKILIVLELLIKRKFIGTRNELINQINKEHSHAHIKRVIKDLIEHKALVFKDIKQINGTPYNIYELNYQALIEFYTRTTTGMLSAYVIEEHHRNPIKTPTNTRILLFSINGLVEDRETEIKEKYK